MSRLDFYTVDELITIIKRSSSLLRVDIDDEGALELARRSRGTPRLANRFLKRIRDFAQVRFDGRITAKVAKEALDLMEVDPIGLDNTDRSVIETMIHNHVRWIRHFEQTQQRAPLHQCTGTFRDFL